MSDHGLLAGSQAQRIQRAALGALMIGIHCVQPAPDDVVVECVLDVLGERWAT